MWLLQAASTFIPSVLTLTRSSASPWIATRLDTAFDAIRFRLPSRHTKERSNDPNRFSVDGDLTIHGVTKPVTLAVEATPAVKDAKGNERRGAEATTKLSRKDFGVSADPTIVGDEVQIKTALELGDRPLQEA